MDAAALVWMFVVLKIPIVLLLWLVWYAIKEPEPAIADDREDGGSDRSRRPPPRKPSPPRRGGPHAAPSPAPRRVRTAARSRDNSHS